MKRSTNQKIKTLRAAMAQSDIDAYLIPSSDPHQSEYVTDYWKIRAWISGFTGSAGLLVVTQKHAGLWTDSRYFLQAEQELENTVIELMKMGEAPFPEYTSWLAEHLPKNAIIGLDGKLFSFNQLEHLQKKVAFKDIRIDPKQDLIAAIWSNRPPLPDSPVFEHDLAFAGKTRAEKIAAVRTEMASFGADYHLLSALDDIAWTFNIRGRDISFNPVAIAYAIIGRETTYLFIDAQKVPDALAEILLDEGIIINPYKGIDQFLSSLSKEKVLIDPKITNAYLYELLDEDLIIHGKSIPTTMKAAKNSVEIAHIKQVMIKDGIALVHLYRWLEKELKSRTVSESELAEQLIAFRKKQDNYFGESFPAIVGYNANGAIVHYRPMPDDCAQIEKSGILLLDSGGQYMDGTTDITRTIALGKPTNEQKKHFTLVLKGHIALANLIFPKGTKGIQMDILARQALWQHRLDYGHGTGHGVGFFLNVHEPPQSISYGVQRGAIALKEGMLTSNEPGYYKDGDYGIRIENLILVTADDKDEDFLAFETVSLFPIDKKLIDLKLLTNIEIDWLNQYHQKVMDGLNPFLNISEQRWLREKCQEIG